MEVLSSATVANSIGEFLAKDFKEEERNIIFPALHGTNGEDGTIQGLLELINVPYVGNEVLSSAAGMDKVVMKDLFTRYNIPQTKYTSVKLHAWKEDEENVYKDVEIELNYPLYIKPANSGSSVGISIAKKSPRAENSIWTAFLYDTKIVVEEEVIGREMQISVIGNNHPKASIPGEFILEKPFFWL